MPGEVQIRFQKNPFFTKRAVRYWSKWPREVVESPCLEAFQRCLDVALGDSLGVIMVVMG